MKMKNEAVVEVGGDYMFIDTDLKEVFICSAVTPEGATLNRQRKKVSRSQKNIKKADNHGGRSNWRFSSVCPTPEVRPDCFVVEDLEGEDYSF